jgi:hypothetical protein
MKKLFGLILLCTLAFAEVETEGYIGLDSQSYSKKDSKHSYNLTLQQQLKLTYTNELLSSVVELYAQEDSTDFTNKKDNDRTFTRVNEAYMLYEFDEDQILFGKNIRFWGALEANNIVDTFNIQDSRNDPLRTDKIGAYNFEYSHYFEESEFSFITKLYEQKNKFSSTPYMYSALNEGESLEDKLDSEKSLYRPTIYLKYSGSISEDYALDYAFIYQNGYDSQRYSTKSGDIYTQHAYLVNKFMTYNTMVIDSTLYKLELSYTNVTNNNIISNYIHAAVGVEHTLEQLEDGTEIGLIGEYYYYDTVDDNKLSDIDLNQSFQNDLFLGLRYSLNDEADTSAVGGVVLDTQYEEQSYYVEYETRVLDTFKLKLDARYIEPSTSHNTTFAKQGRQHRFGFNISYHF